MEHTLIEGEKGVAGMTQRSESEFSEFDSLSFDGHGNLIDLSDPKVSGWGPPPEVTWLNVLDVSGTLFGRRVCHMTPDGPHFDCRAASEVFEEAGDFHINVVAEAQWYWWLDQPEDSRTPRPPYATPLDARTVWVAHVAPWTVPEHLRRLW